MLRRARIRSVGILVAAAVAALATACSSSGIGSPDGDGSGAQPLQTFAAGSRQQAPTLSGTTLDGKQLSTADYRGKVVVLNFWGSWCAPCRSEAASLEQVSQDTQAKGVQFIGVDTRDQDAQARAFLQDVGITYPSLVDSQGQLQIRFSHLFSPSAVPVTVVLDRQGRIAALFTGPVLYTSLAQQVNTVAAEPA